MCMCVHVCVHVYLCSVAMHTFLAGQRGTDEQTVSEGGLALRHLCVCVRLCAYNRVRGNHKNVLYVLFWSTFGVCFVVLGGHNSCWWLSCVSKMCSLPPARHINHCLPHWVTLHHTNPSARNSNGHSTEIPQYFLTQTFAYLFGRINAAKANTIYYRHSLPWWGK